MRPRGAAALSRRIQRASTQYSQARRLLDIEYGRLESSRPLEGTKSRIVNGQVLPLTVLSPPWPLSDLGRELAQIVDLVGNDIRALDNENRMRTVSAANRRGAGGAKANRRRAEPTRTLVSEAESKVGRDPKVIQHWMARNGKPPLDAKTIRRHLTKRSGGA